MLKAVHIHTDVNFLHQTNHFNKRWFDNRTFVIGEKKSLTEVSGVNPTFVSYREADSEGFVAICSDADLVVLYDLDYVKSLLALKLPRKTTVAWRFFGYELYKRRIADCLSARSLTFREMGKGRKVSLESRRLMGQLKNWVTRRTDPEEVFASAMKRADVFLGMSRLEHEHLCRVWSGLPPFVQIPLNFETSKHSSPAKDNVVIIGNNRSIYNNHLDLIDLIETTEHDFRLCFLVPFSYGDEDSYTEEVRRRVASSRRNIRLLNDFMPRKSYFELLANARAGVSNSFRQMGLGNIREFLNAGTKLYFSNRNVIYLWFKELGLRVYTIEDFRSDLSSNNLELSPEEKEWNWKVLEEISSVFNQERFAVELSNAINRKAADYPAVET